MNEELREQVATALSPFCAGGELRKAALAVLAIPAIAEALAGRGSAKTIDAAAVRVFEHAFVENLYRPATGWFDLANALKAVFPAVQEFAAPTPPAPERSDADD